LNLKFQTSNVNVRKSHHLEKWLFKEVQDMA
jgi:hypothetical protein